MTYINLPAGRDCYGVFYVHPNTLSRYCGNGTYEDFDRKFNVHVEAYIGGKLVDYIDKNKDADKWLVGPDPGTQPGLPSGPVRLLCWRIRSAIRKSSCLQVRGQGNSLSLGQSMLYPL